jgi:peptide/nickel transport system substrate-binding protein
MFSSKKFTLAFGILVIASMILAACQPAVAPTAERVVETVVVTQLVEGTPVEVVQVVTPTPEPEGERTLVICLGQEPDTLYKYGGSMLAAAQVEEAIWDGGSEPGGIDSRTFSYQPILYEKIPSVADGDAVINTVTVAEGDTVVDANQEPVTLEAGIMVVPAGETEPVEYTGGEIELEQMEVTWTLLPDLLWADGTPLTSSDLVYDFNLRADPDSNVSKFLTDRTASFEATDDLSVLWTGLPGYKDGQYQEVGWEPSPEHAWGQFTAAELLEAEESARLPIGYGPYVIDEWVQGDNIRLHANPNYFRAAEGLPRFENLVYRIIGENSNAAIAAVLAGECDIIDQTVGLDDQSELLLELQGAGQINPTFVTGTVWEHVDFGIQHIDYDDGYQQGSDRPDFFSDVRTRRAFIMCMDRQAVVDTVTFGQSVVIDTYIPQQHPLFNEEATHYDFDVEAAGALLDEVGWMDDDGDPTTPRVSQGVAGVPDGTPLTVAYETTNATLRQQVTQIVQESLGQCGINAEITLYPASEWFADGPEGKLFGRRFDLGEFAWLTGVQPPCELYDGRFVPGDPEGTWTPVMDPEASGQTFPQGWGGQNNPGFFNPEYDAACSQALTSLPGQPGYEQGHLESQALFADQLPVAPLFLRLKLAASRTDMCGFVMDPTENSEMWNIEEFDYGPGCE